MLGEWKLSAHPNLCHLCLSSLALREGIAKGQRQKENLAQHALGKGDRGHQLRKQVWCLKLKTVGNLGGGERVERGAQEGHGSGQAGYT